MGKFIDGILITGIVFLSTYGWCRYAPLPRSVAAGVAVLSAVCVLSVYIGIVLRRSKTGKFSYYNFFFALSVKGNTENARSLAESAPENAVISIEENMIVADYNGKRVLVFVNYKLGETTAEDIFKAYRFAVKNSIETVYALAKDNRRQARLASSELNVRFIFPLRRELKTYYVKHNLVPKLPEKTKKRSVKLRFSEIFEFVTDSRRIKYYIFSAALLAVFSLFTPLKLYYLILSALPLTLAFAGIIKRATD